MYNPEEELRAIMDLLAEWRSKTGTGDVNIFILASGHGMAGHITGTTISQPTKSEGILAHKKTDPRRVEPSRVQDNNLSPLV